MTATDVPDAPARFAYVGCFTTQARRARGDGLHVHAIGPDGAWTPLQHLPDLVNPSFLVMGPGARVLYVAHGDQDYASAYARDAGTGRLRPLGRAATGGANVVHQAVDPSGRHLVVTNYGTGSVAVLPLREDGGLDPYAQRLAMPGTAGPHRTEQAGSHPHQILFDPAGRFVLVPDKGHDAVCVFALAEGALELASVTASRPGAGPRHGAFHPTLPVYWVLNELDSSITTHRWSAADGTLEPVQVLPTLPPGFFGASTAAAIVVTPDGGFVHASNRGQDGVASFAVEPGTGCLRPLGWTPAPGREPRFMTLLGDQLLVASERDDRIDRFAPDPGGGLHPVGATVASASPVSVALA